MNEQKTDLVDRGACWKHADKNGKPYLSGTIKEDDGTVREILIFINNKKDNPKAPDYRIKEKVPHVEQAADADDFMGGGELQGEDKDGNVPF
jgi:uncharacterized protein (DUF736 family)